MAVVVIDALKVIDVKENDGKGTAGPFGIVHPLIQCIIKLLAVVDAGQGILGREFKEFPVGDKGLPLSSLHPAVVDVRIDQQNGLVGHDSVKLGCLQPLKLVGGGCKKGNAETNSNNL